MLVIVDKRDYQPTRDEPSSTVLPKRGPDWLIAPTRHHAERVGYDGDTIFIPHYESGRLYAEFRETIRSSDFGGIEPIPMRIATAAAYHRVHDEERARAIADLTVTGRESFRALGVRRVGDPIDWDRIAALAEASGLLPATIARRGMSGLPPLPAPRPEDVRRAIERARRVAEYLASPEKKRGALRGELGWIAASGEDDLPLRPVNVRATDFPQHDTTLRVWGLDVPIRYVVAGTPTPTSKNVLLLHGHSSRLEEVEELTRGLVSAGYVVLTLDLPSNGYSGQLEHEHVLFAEAPARSLPLPYAREPRDPRRHSSLYTLRFLLETLHALVTHVFAEHGLSPRIDLVAGGSLGGNLGLLLSALAPFGDPARHAWVDPRFSWVKRVASWSPACLWEQPNLATGTPHDRSLEPEDEDRRRDHLNRWMNVDHIFVVVVRQAEQWYRRGWPGKRRALAESWLARHETYSPRYRRWHWIVAHEQMKFSHRRSVLRADGQESTTRGYDLFGGELLLMAGRMDDYAHSNIASDVATYGPKITHAHGHALIWDDTGHSIHDERPRELAAVLDRFVRGRL